MSLVYRLSPVDNSQTWAGTWATNTEIDEAANRASQAFGVWSQMPLEQRCSMARLYAQYLDSHRRDIARTITLESGKPLWESDAEVQSAISKVPNAIEAIYARRNKTSHESGASRSVIRYRALGRLVVLGPYNLPLHLPGAHIVPALLAGNSVLFKPSEKTPAVGDWIARAWQSTGLPAGVLETVHGAVEQAKHAVALNDTAGVLFTGSYAAGSQLHKQLAGRPECLLALEMGGNNPLVVHQYRNTKAAIATILQSAYITSGQRCTCTRKLILIESSANRRLLANLSTAINQVRVGSPLAAPQPFMGTLVTAQAASSILFAQEKYRSLGGTIWNEARVVEGHPALISPSLVEADLDVMSAIAKIDEEHFGPLLVACFVHTLDEALAVSNQTKYGLAAGLFSDDTEAWEHFANHVRAGIVNWNAPTTGATGTLPFGGIGASGNHRPSGYFAADYCSDPVASIENCELKMPASLPPGLESLA